VLRDLQRFGAVELVAERSGAEADGLRRAVEDPAWGALHGRRQLERVVRSLQVAALRESEPASAELLERRHLTPGWQPDLDPDYADLIERSLSK
jgi:hypothetical protein